MSEHNYAFHLRIKQRGLHVVVGETGVLCTIEKIPLDQALQKITKDSISPVMNARDRSSEDRRDAIDVVCKSLTIINTITSKNPHLVTKPFLRKF